MCERWSQRVLKEAPCYKVLSQRLSEEAEEIQETASNGSLNRNENWIRIVLDMKLGCNPMIVNFGPETLSKKLESVMNSLADLIHVI